MRARAQYLNQEHAVEQCCLEQPEHYCSCACPKNINLAGGKKRITLNNPYLLPYERISTGLRVPSEKAKASAVKGVAHGHH